MAAFLGVSKEKLEGQLKDPSMKPFYVLQFNQHKQAVSETSLNFFNLTISIIIIIFVEISFL